MNIRIKSIQQNGAITISVGKVFTVFEKDGQEYILDDVGNEQDVVREGREFMLSDGGKLELFWSPDP